METLTAGTPAPFTITARALDRLRAVAEAESVDTAGQVLRVAVVAGGCSGLSYDLGWDTAVGPADETFTAGPLRVAVDPRSLIALDGTVLDFSDGLDGRGFSFDNPQAARTCACGESFSM